MKNFSLIALTIALTIGCSNAQSLEKISLPSPQKDLPVTFMEAVANRLSTREFNPETLSAQTLSDVLWAANGVNRPDGKRTAPSCRNFQEVLLYVLTKEGAYAYEHTAHELQPLAAGDFRGLVAGGQEAVKDAPAIILMGADMTKFGEVNPQSRTMASVDVGIVCQNINLACSALNLLTVPRATMDTLALAKELKLPETVSLIMNNPISYPVKK